MTNQQTIGGTLRQDKGDRGGLELSYLREDNVETWTLLDNVEGHRQFDSGAAAEQEYESRLARRRGKP